METVSRREFLRLSSLGAALAVLGACRPLQADAGPAWRPVAEGEEALLLHTLRRTTFGPSAADLEQARDLGLEAWLEAQLHPDGSEGLVVEAVLSRLPTLSMSPAELAGLEGRGQVVRELVVATLTRQMFSPWQLYEVMVDFWSNHFNIHIRSGPVALLKGADDREVIRRHALGTFPDLLRASAHSPAMLVYLDNAHSRAPNPNENYARELLELHTLGVDGGYTQEDVVAAARALTGWTVRSFRAGEAAGTFVFRPGWHDQGPKTFLGQPLPGSGKEDGDRLLDILAEHPSTARHIARRLAVRFVSDDPPASLVDKVARTYQETDGDIPAMLRTLFTSTEFAAAVGQKLKRPLDFFVSAFRTLGVEARLQRGLFETLVTLGQVPFHWPAPDGYPDVAPAWTNTNQALYRWSLALLLTSEDLHGLSTDVPALAEAAVDEADLVDRLSVHLLGAPLPEDARRVLLDYAATSGSQRLAFDLAALILASPHFQLR